MSSFKDFKTGQCITCKHFFLEDSGREFANIADTEYIQFRCSVYGEKTKKEYFLMVPAENEINETRKSHCEFWEEWVDEKTIQAD